MFAEVPLVGRKSLPTPPTVPAGVQALKIVLRRMYGGLGVAVGVGVLVAVGVGEGVGVLVGVGVGVFVAVGVGVGVGVLVGVGVFVGTGTVCSTVKVVRRRLSTPRLAAQPTVPATTVPRMTKLRTRHTLTRQAARSYGPTMTRCTPVSAAAGGSGVRSTTAEVALTVTGPALASAVPDPFTATM